MVLNAVTRPLVRLRAWFRNWREDREGTWLWKWGLGAAVLYLVVCVVMWII